MNQESKYCVYKITSPSGKIYFGYTSNFYQRMIGHKSDAKRRSYKIQNSIKKYGFENHNIEIVYQSNDINSVKRAEREFILVFNTIEFGLNISTGGDGGSPSEEVREKMRLSANKRVAIMREKGQRIGMKPKYDLSAVYSDIKDMILAGETESTIVQLSGYSKGTIYRAKKAFGN